MAIVKITKENFVDEVLGAAKPVIIDFYADWCGPCKALAPTLEELSEERDDIKFCKVNVDDEPDIAVTFEITVIPTLAVMKDGALIAKNTGVIGKKSILGMVEKQ